MKALDNTMSERVRAAALALMLYDSLHYMLVHTLLLKITLPTDLSEDLRKT